MSKIRPSKEAGIALLSTVFNIVNMNTQTQRKHKSMNQCVQDVLDNNDFDIQMPININTADEYAKLYAQAFNASTFHLFWKGVQPNHQSVDIETQKFISYLSGNNIIKVAKNLKQEIY